MRSTTRPGPRTTVDGDAKDSGDDADAAAGTVAGVEPVDGTAGRGAEQPTAAGPASASIAAARTMMTLDAGDIGMEGSSAGRRRNPDQIPARGSFRRCLRTATAPTNASTK